MAASTFPAADAFGQPPDWRTYEAHIESWCNSAPPGEERVRARLKNQILAAFHSPEEYLDLRDQTDIISLPPGLWLAGSLDLRRCTGLEALPEGLHVGGHACFLGCTALIALPEGLHIEGHLNMRGCTNLTTLPQTFHFGGSVNLEGSSALRELPVEWNVDGDLDISFCTRLASLVVDWNIRGNLNASNCTDLTDMSGSLRADGGLNFSRCSELAVFPGILKFDKWINLSFCKEAKILHPSIMMSRENRTPLTVYLRGSGLSPDVLESLRNNTSISNVRFDTSLRGPRVLTSRRTVPEASMQSWRQMEGASPLSFSPGTPPSGIDGARRDGSGHLFASALAAALNAVSSPLLPPSRRMPPHEEIQKK